MNSVLIGLRRLIAPGGFQDARRGGRWPGPKLPWRSPETQARDSGNALRGVPGATSTGGPHRGPEKHTPLDRYPEPSLLTPK